MAVMNMLMPVAGLIKIRFGDNKADIDSPFFKLHYRTTTTILLISCILVTANDLIGFNINCINDTIQSNVLSTYCWIMSTFSVPSRNAAGQGNVYPYQGVQPYIEGQSERTLHAYYQWVPFVLFLQAVLFYFPHYLWKVFEDRKITKITSGLRGRTLRLQDRKEQCKVLTEYIKETWNTHNLYTLKYFICDSLNFVNVIGQMYLINTFLGGVFMTYGTDVLKWNEAEPEDRTDPMIDVFPRVTKCHFHKYGPSGTIERHDAMCVLPLNIINEKIYVMLWFWFIILALITSLYMLYVLAMISVPSLRKVLLERNAKSKQDQEVNVLMKKGSLGDWFVIFLLSKNLDSTLFSEFITQVAEKLKTSNDPVA